MWLETEWNLVIERPVDLIFMDSGRPALDRDTNAAIPYNGAHPVFSVRIQMVSRPRIEIFPVTSGADIKRRYSENSFKDHRQVQQLAADLAKIDRKATGVEFDEQVMFFVNRFTSTRTRSIPPGLRQWVKPSERAE